MSALAYMATHNEIIYTSDLHPVLERDDFYASVARGVYVRMFRGVYVRSSLWAGLDDDERYRMRVRTTARFGDDRMVYSHEAAVVLWHLPWFGDWPVQVHVTTPLAAGGRSRAMFLRHTTGVPERVDLVEGLRVTTVARTVVDIARTRPFAAGLAVADAALRPNPESPYSERVRGLAVADLLSELERIPRNQGEAKARAVVESADGRAESVGESVSRATMVRLGIGIPQMQARLEGASGRVWIVDFFWAKQRVIGEFDGAVKYRDPRYLRGRSPEQVVIEEKLREDDLRNAGYRVLRWDWSTAFSARALGRLLARAGVS